MGPRAGLDDMEKRKFLTLSGLELRPLGCPARSQSLYRLYTRGGQIILPKCKIRDGKLLGRQVRNNFGRKLWNKYCRKFSPCLVNEVVNHHAMKTYGGVKVYLQHSWRRHLMEWSASPTGGSAPGTVRIGGWIGPRADLEPYA
jgi:hypothetical protein